MPSVPAGRYGAVLFAVRTAPWMGMTFMLAGGVAVWLVTDAMFVRRVIRNPAPIFESFGWIFLLLAVLFCAAGFQQLFRPPVLYEVAEEGIVTYENFESSAELFNGDGFLIPWDRIESLKYVSKMGYARRGKRHGYILHIDLQVRNDNDWYLPKSNFRPGRPEDRYYITAAHRPGGRDLFERLSELHRRYRAAS